MERQNPKGNSQPEKTTARPHTIRGKILSLMASGNISAEMDAVGATEKDETNSWNKSCKESVKRETELYRVFEAAVTDETQEQKERGMIRDLLEQLQRRREEEDEARGLMEEMQRNLDEAQNRSYEVERKSNWVLWEYIEAFDKERGRPRLIMTKLWQMMQSRDTKNLNLARL